MRNKGWSGETVKPGKAARGLLLQAQPEMEKTSAKLWESENDFEDISKIKGKGFYGSYF